MAIYARNEQGQLVPLRFPTLKGDKGEKGDRGLEGPQGPQGEKGETGYDGKSAYELAIDNGFVGSEEQWLESLKGQDGIDGKDGESGVFVGSLDEAPESADIIIDNSDVGLNLNFAKINDSAIAENTTWSSNKINEVIKANGGGSTSVDDNDISTAKTWSSAKIEEYVLNNDNAVWVDKSGENVKIDSIKEGYLREIEIWGNTIQDEEDSSDIRHLGELYVNEEGEPILDDLGREQYKIEIKTVNRNLINPNQDYTDDSAISGEGIVNTFNGYALLNDYIPVKPDTKYHIKNGDHVATFDKDKKFINKQAIWGGNGKPATFTTPSNTKYIRVQICWSTVPNKDLHNVQLSDSYSDDTFIPHQSNKITILLPCQLSKVGNTVDKLYWDNESGRYIIEKNIHYAQFNSGDIKLTGGSASGENYGTWGGIYVDGDYDYRKGFIDNVDANKATISLYPRGGKSEINISFKNTSSLEEAKLKLNELFPIKIFYGAIENKIIETNITEQIKLPTYINTTYLTATGGIEGSVKAKTPVDGSAIINSLIQANYELKQENEELKIDIEDMKKINQEQDNLIDLSFLATDEMYSILEPLLINNISLDENNESYLVSMYVAMVQRKLKTIEQVPARYKEQVKKIISGGK